MCDFCASKMSVNGGKKQIFESGRDHNVIESSVDLARHASDFDLILPYAAEYTTIIHEGSVTLFFTIFFFTTPFPESLPPTSYRCY